MNIGTAIALRFDDRVACQQLVSLRDGFAVEIEIVGELTNRGQRITRLQSAGSYRGLDLFDELLELRHGVVNVDGNFQRSSLPMYQLYPWYIGSDVIATPKGAAAQKNETP